MSSAGADVDADADADADADTLGRPGGVGEVNLSQARLRRVAA